MHCFTVEGLLGVHKCAYPARLNDCCNSLVGCARTKTVALDAMNYVDARPIAFAEACDAMHWLRGDPRKIMTAFPQKDLRGVHCCGCELTDNVVVRSERGYCFNTAANFRVVLL